MIKCVVLFRGNDGGLTGKRYYLKKSVPQEESPDTIKSVFLPLLKSHIKKEADELSG